MQFRTAVFYTISHTFSQLCSLKVFCLSKPLSPCFFTTSRARWHLAKNDVTHVAHVYRSDT